MGFLDDVKRKQAEERAQTGASNRERQVPEHVKLVEPQLEVLRDGLGAFARRLNAALPNIRTTYHVEGYGPLLDLKQMNYVVVSEDENGLKVSLKFECRGDAPVEFCVTSREACDAELQYLLANGLHVQYRSRADWRFVFNLESLVPVSLEFSAHSTDAAVELKIRNLETIGQRAEYFPPERIDEEFLTELRNCVLRQPNRFNELCGNTVPDDMRERLRTRVAARQQKREEQVAGSGPANEGTAGRGGLRGLLGKLKNKS